ncbi:DUF4238 domain-containing protein [Flavobacterium agrisoli]|uniref:DUF4238 domain-containing protein n=1 Tax=Flavobacterium agrisoli TaxID=2793066 RepID=A0A934PLU2_9FLAO|nr:DUF4238 domain-containing protein [Flavobacterium agrisoli]MBK0368743.1 DUF4238 domain-containing protein [Flavobacterium agrisoli]
MSTKRKHHYVWREYLRSWSCEEKIYSYIKSKNKIAKPNLMGVAQQRFFYSLEEFSLEEEIILKELVKQYSNCNVSLKINLELLNIYTSYSRLKRLDKENVFETNSEKQIEKLSQILELLRTNLFEEFHTIIENYGQKVVKIKNFEDLKMFENDDELFFTMIFLCSQFLRTKKMKNSLELVFNKSEFIIPKYTNIISLVFANSLAVSLSQNENIKFIFYENETEIKFLTSDQPLMNLLINDKDENSKVKNFELYYPINPKVAIVIHFEQQNLKYERIKIDKQKVTKLNDFLFEYAEEFVFAINEEQLTKYKNSR